MAKYTQRRADASGKPHQLAAQHPVRPALQDNRSSAKTGIPGKLKTGMEGVSGMSLDHVRVHYNSDKPEQYGAHAYAQGSDVHLAPGQEHHLPHELGHIVQQAQGRVSATRQMKGAALNDDPGLEAEATQLGKQAQASGSVRHLADNRTPAGSGTIQRYAWQGENAVMQRSVVSDFTWSLLNSQFKTLGLNGLLTLADTGTLYLLTRLETFTQIVGKVTTFANALTIAINIWDAIPAPVKTGILFLTGKVATYLPNETIVNYSHTLLVAADGDGTVGRLRTVLDYLQMIIQAVKNPVTSVFNLGKHIYSTWWGGEKTESTHEDKKAATPEERKKDLASIDLHIIWLKVGSIGLKNTQKKEEDKDEQKGGLHATFALGYRLFDYQGSYGEDGKLTLILPWEGGAILQAREPISLVNKIVFGGDFFVVRQLHMTSLSVSNEGLDELAFSLQEFSLGNGTVSATNVTAEYKKAQGAIFEAQKAGLKIYDWEADAHLKLNLAADGTFEQGSMTNFKESAGLVTIEKAQLSNNDGFMLENAQLNLEKLTQLDIKATIAQLQIKEGLVKGSGDITGQNIRLLGEKIILEHIKGEATAEPGHWSASVDATLKMLFSEVNAQGSAKISYDSKEKITHIEIYDGQITANYDAFSFAATDLGYSHDQKRFSMKSAKLLIKSIGVEGSVSNVTIDENGISFATAIVKGPDKITLFDGFTLDQLQLLIKQNGESMTLSSNATLERAKVKGKAKQLEIGFDADGFKGSLASADVSTSLFGLDIQNGQVDKDGFSVESATLKLLPASENSNGKEMTDFVPDFNSGLMDFLPFGSVAFKVEGVNLNKTGLTIRSFKPKLDEIRFSAFGASARLNLEQMFGEIGYKKSLSLQELAVGLPLHVSMIFPVFPGLEVYGSLGADANLDIDILLNAKGQEGVWSVGDHAKFSGAILLRAELGANIGSQVIAALSAGFFAQGKAMLHSNAGLQGAAKFNRKKRTFDAIKPLIIDYSFKPEAVASIGVVIKAKALYFINKTLFEYTAAEWRMGNYELTGKIGDNNDKMVPETPEHLGIEDNKLNSPDYREIKGEEEQSLLKSNRTIGGSGDIRKAMLNREREEVELLLKALKQESIVAAKKREAIKEKYIKLMSRKVIYFNAIHEGMNSTDVNQRLLEFNEKFGLELLKEQYEALVYKEEQLTKDIQINIGKMEKLAKINPAILEENGLAFPLAKVQESKNQAQKLHFPDTQALEHSLEMAIETLEAAIEQDNIVMAGLAGVMSPADFISYSTTSGLFGKTVRKNIQSVDNALVAFHNDKSEANLKLLAQAIKIYLTTSPESGRGPVVKVLQEQVRAALKTFH